MYCSLVVLDKHPGVLPVEIGETLRKALVRLFFRVVGDQVKIACGNLLLCSGIEARVEVDMHSVLRRKRKRGTSQGYRGQETGREGMDQIEEEDMVGDWKYKEGGGRPWEPRLRMTSAAAGI